jgi:hypothetical protein
MSRPDAVAVIDESYGVDGDCAVYVVAAVLVPREPQDLACVREHLAALRLHGQRPHFARDGDKRRRQVLETLRRLGLRPPLVVVRTTAGAEAAERSRGLCLARIGWELRHSASALLIERRGRKGDAHDRSVLRSVRGLVAAVEFAAPEAEPLLWAADAVASAVFQAEARRRREYVGVLGECDVIAI